MNSLSKINRLSQSNLVARGLSTSPSLQAKQSKNTGKNLVLVEGVRTPFLMSSTDYKSLMPHDLQRYALTGLVNKVGLDKSLVDYICMGTVIQVREAAKCSFLCHSEGGGGG